jgi:hypothetical protein
MDKQPHGVEGQINIFVLDKDSDITGYGKHNRLLVFRGTGKDGFTITVREDIRGLPLSTEDDRRAVLMGWQRMHPRGQRLDYVSSVRYDAYDAWESIEHTYQIKS